MQTHVSEFSPLPDELLSTVCRFIGVAAAVPSLLSSTRLHSAWQRAIESLSIKGKKVTARDIDTIKKYVGLRKLTLIGLEGSLSTWMVVGQLAPILTQLTNLTIKDEDEAFGVLNTIHFSGCLSTRLQHLCLQDCDHKLLSSDLVVLKDLAALVSLDLTCAGSSCSNDKLPDFTGAFKSLRALTMYLTEDAQLDTHVLSRFPGSITSLKSLRLELSDDLDYPGADVQPLLDAFSSLSNLEQLHADSFLEDAATQRHVLLNLSKLTHLTYAGSNLAVPDALQDLRELHAPWAKVDGSILLLPSLELLKVCELQFGPTWHMKVVDGCPLKELRINPEYVMELEDESLQNLPTLPQLHTLALQFIIPTDGAYVHLASVLRRHARLLRTVELAVTHAFEEGLPRKFPACTSLRIDGVSKHTLQLLSMCKLPALEELTLLVCDADVDVQHDLWWLKELPSLKRLVVPRCSTFDADKRAAVAQLLAPRNVQMSWR